MSWTDTVSSISAAVAAGTSVVVAVLALRKYFQSKDLEYEANRPFIIPRLLVEDKDGEKLVFLEIKNVGDTPARNVKIEFLSDGKWNWVADPEYPFSKNPGIAAIGPNNSVSYFLGAIRQGNPLEDLERRELSGFVEFDHPVKRIRISDEFRTSLTENRYKAK
jgi:hypothetical protein